MFRILLVSVCLMTGISGFLWAQLKVHTNGNVSISTIPNSAPTARLYISAGDERAITLVTDHQNDWSQSISTTVNRIRTFSYVVRRRDHDRFLVSGDGEIIAKSAWFYSDSTLKQHVKSIENPLQNLMKVRGVSFQYKPEAECDSCTVESDSALASITRPQFGVLAQEIEKIFPELVSEAPDQLKVVAYHQMIPILIEAMKEQQAEIEKLKADVEVLKLKVR